MKTTWLDSYFFAPNFWQKILAFLLLPLSFLYGFVAILNTKFKKKFSPKVPVISVGNLSVGGNGKTPICKALALFLKEQFPQKQIFIILRGYKRASKGLLVVKFKDKSLEVQQSGDEAAEYAFENAINGVIVSANRVKGIEKACELGADIILLDDAFSKFHIEKFDIVLESKIKPKFPFLLPSGVYRLPRSFLKKADFIALEGRDFFRHSFVKENPKAILITAIAKPFRLYEHFIKARACYFFKDHYEFKKEELQTLLKKHNCDTLMLTFKDFVKVKDFGFKTQIISLDITLSEDFKQKILSFIKDKNETCLHTK